MASRERQDRGGDWLAPYHRKRDFARTPEPARHHRPARMAPSGRTCRPPRRRCGSARRCCPGPDPDELAALDAMRSGGAWRVFGRELRLTNVGKVLFPAPSRPYSPRPPAGAPVSTPITWDELDDADLQPDAFTIRTVFDRLVEKGDPFRAVLGTDQTLPALR